MTRDPATIPASSSPPPGPQRARAHRARRPRDVPELPQGLPAGGVARARAPMVEDVDGNRYLDFAAGIAVAATGHCHPEVVAAIRRRPSASSTCARPTSSTRTWSTLAEGLARRAPGPGPWRVFFANSGAEVVEAAIKLARLRTGRQKIVAFYGAFHGRTYGAMSLTASKPVQRKGYGPFVPEVLHTHYAYCYRCPVNREPVHLLGAVPGPADRDHVRHDGRPARGGGGDRGAGAGRGRLRGAASRLPAAPARAHAEARHPADRRRGAVRDGPHRPPVRERALRPGARHRDAGQGHRVRACRSARWSRATT